MKKLTVFFTLLLCVAFAKMSAQQTLSWANSGENRLQITKNGITVVDSYSSGIAFQTGTFEFENGDTIEIYAINTASYIKPLSVVICEDNYIGSGPNGFFYEDATHDVYNFTNEDHIEVNESFTDCGNDVYVEIKN